MRHIIIWQGDSAGLPVFVQGLHNNRKLAIYRKDLVYLVAYSPEPSVEAGAIPCLPMPQKPDDAEQWQRILTEIHFRIARQIQPGDDPLDTLILSVVISAEHAKDARSMLEAITQATGQIGSVNFRLHIVMLADTFTAHKAGQVALLHSLMEDVNNSRQLKRAKTAAEHEIEQSYDNKRRDSIAEKRQTGMLSTDEISDMTQQLVIEKAQAIQAKRKALEDEYPVLPWKLLTVLTDQDEDNAHTIEITKIRADMLASLILSSNVSNEDFRCLTYNVQRSEFTLLDIQRLPNHLLYEKIRQIREDLNAAKEKLCPPNWRTTITDELRKKITGKRPQLCTALLADDNNYPSRSGKTLLGTFMEFNAELLNSLFGVEAFAQNWLLNAMRLLAGWVDIDIPIQDYIVDAARGLQNDIQALINAEPSFQQKQFGASVKLKDRKEAVQQLLNNELCSSMATCCLKRVIELLPQLRRFMLLINKTNSDLFAHYSEQLNRKLSASAWARQLVPALNRFTLAELNVPDDALTEDGYRKWLVDTLQDRYPPFAENPTIEGLDSEAYADFINKAHEYVLEAQSLKMISKTFGATTQDAVSNLLLLGAENHVYQLTPFKLSTDHLSNDIIAQIFVEHTEDASLVFGAAPARPAAAPRIKAKLSKRELDMRISLKMLRGKLALEWKRPEDEDQASIRITNKDESKCYHSNDTFDYADGRTPSIFLRASELPFGKEMKVTISGVFSKCTQIVQLEPIEIRSLERDELRGLKAILAHLPASETHWRIKLDAINKFKEISFDQWAMVIETGSGVFKYPVPRGDTWLLQVPDGNDPRVRMIVRGAE